MTHEERARKAVQNSWAFTDSTVESVAAAIREACEEAVAEALREGLRAAPSSPERVDRIRAKVVYSWARGQGDRPKGPPPENGQSQTTDVFELLDVISHQAARIAALANDSGQWQDGYRAGKADAEAAAALARAALDGATATTVRPLATLIDAILDRLGPAPP